MPSGRRAGTAPDRVSTLARMVDSNPLAGRVAFVTGASRGIGRAIALALAGAGADVAVADVHPDPFEGERYYRLRARTSGPEEVVSTAAAVAELGRRSMSVAVDVSDADAVVDAVAACTAELGPPDILVNNAGIVNNLASIAEMTPAAWAARAAGQPVGHVPHRAGRRAGHGRAGLGSGHQPLVDRRADARAWASRRTPRRRPA